MITFHHEIRGFLCGQLWQGCLGFAPLVYDLTREDARSIGGPLTLRDQALGALAEHGGDFMGADFGDCRLITTATITKGGRQYRRTRELELARCKSIADMVDPDWAIPDWALD